MQYIFTPDDSVYDLRDQLFWSMQKCADHFNVSLQTWKRWEKDNNLSKAGREFLYFKAGFLTFNRRDSFFGSRITTQFCQVLRREKHSLFNRTDEEIFSSSPILLRNKQTMYLRSQASLGRKKKKIHVLREQLKQTHTNYMHYKNVNMKLKHEIDIILKYNIQRPIVTAEILQFNRKFA